MEERGRTIPAFVRQNWVKLTNPERRRLALWRDVPYWRRTDLHMFTFNINTFKSNDLCILYANRKSKIHSVRRTHTRFSVLPFLSPLKYSAYVLPMVRVRFFHLWQKCCFLNKFQNKIICTENNKYSSELFFVNASLISVSELNSSYLWQSIYLYKFFPIFSVPEKLIVENTFPFYLGYISDRFHLYRLC